MLFTTAFQLKSKKDIIYVIFFERKQVVETIHCFNFAQNIIAWMNEWVSEWMNKWIDGWMVEWINKKWMNEWMNE